MEERIIVEIKGYDKIIKNSAVKVINIANELGRYDVVAALVNNRLVELNYELQSDSKLELLDISSRLGLNIYLNGLKFLYIVAVKELFDVNVSLKHSIDKGIYTKIGKKVDELDVAKIKEKMAELVNEDLTIQKITTTKSEAIKYFEEVNEYEKIENYRHKTNDIVTLYSLDNYYNYFYGVLPASTGVLKKFDLELTNDNAIILMHPNTNGEISKFTSQKIILKEFDDYEEWSSDLGVNYVSEVNSKVINGKIKEFILLNELKQNEKLNEVSTYIKNNLDTIKIVLVSGPTSSGKTTTSKRLALYLKSKGINPFIISMDNYFKNREDTPINEKGERLLDSIEAIDVDSFNNDLNKLLNKESVKLPTFNFIKGEREYLNEPVSLSTRDLIIIEGIHALNDKLLSKIGDKYKLKIYVSPFTPLALDRHNYVSTVDLRFIRCLVRDFRTRGRNAYDSLKAWGQVRDSEEKFIFPYQEKADIVINTALIYELGMLKTYALPLLESIDEENEFYPEAVRIINFLKNFLDIPTDYLPETSVLREFVGKGYFE